MARKAVDVFGFDELEKAFKRCEKRYPNEADAVLMAAGQQVNKKVKSLTPTRTRRLRNSWRLKKVKLYKGGKVRVVREQTTAPHGHLIEDGHWNVPRGPAKRGDRTRTRSKHGASATSRTPGKHMLETAMSEARTSFKSKVERMLDDLTKDIQV